MTFKIMTKTCCGGHQHSEYIVCGHIEESILKSRTSNINPNKLLVNSASN